MNRLAQLIALNNEARIQKDNSYMTYEVRNKWADIYLDTREEISNLVQKYDVTWNLDVEIEK